jgi:YesN/AraC family two-component response regulator
VNRTKPISQVDVEEEMIRLVTMLEDETENFERLIQDMANKEATYKSSWAKEYLSAKGSIKERESWADYRLEKETFSWKIAEALVKGKREKLSSLRTSIDALRTLAANVRSQTH